MRRTVRAPARARALGALTALALACVAALSVSTPAQGQPAGAPALAAGLPATGIPVLPPLPEPSGSQFVDGPTFTPPTAPPATDIGRRQSRSLVAGTYTCAGYSNIDDANPPSAILQDTFAWGGFKPYKVGDGSGNVSWRLNPYSNPSWYMWLHSLRWLGQGITAGAAGDHPTLDHVVAIAHDWVRDNPFSWKSDIGAWESTMHRTNVLICLRQAILSADSLTAVPAQYAWLDAALNAHARFLTENWSGAWNHGTDESIALFGVGCTLDNADYRNLAVDRLGQGITTSIDTQGSTNEQSTAYAQFNYDLWGRAQDVLLRCNVDPGQTIGQRRVLLATWLAHATNSQGTLHQIGDSEVVHTSAHPGTPMEYVGTLGESGAPPAERVAIYSRGYVFGRTGWGDDGRSYGEESSYSIRYGDSRALHGHNDHTSITYTSRGRDIVIDSGHAGYQPDAWRAWVRSTPAHSVLSTPLSSEGAPSTRLTRSLVTDTSEFFEFTDSPATGITRTRGVLFLQDPDLLITLDRATSKTAQQFQTLWHLPSDQSGTVYSRTTAIAAKPGDSMRTILFQPPYKQPLPPGAILVKDGQTSPIQGWHYPNIGLRNAAPTVMMARSGTSATILSVIAPVPSASGVLYRTTQAGTSTILDLTVAGTAVRVLISGGGGLVRQ